MLTCTCTCRPRVLTCWLLHVRVPHACTARATSFSRLAHILTPRVQHTSSVCAARLTTSTGAHADGPRRQWLRCGAQPGAVVL